MDLLDTSKPFRGLKIRFHAVSRVPLNGEIMNPLCNRSDLIENQLFKYNVTAIALSSTGVARTRFAFSEVSGTGLMVAKEVTRRPAMRASFEAPS